MTQAAAQVPFNLPQDPILDNPMESLDLALQNLLLGRPGASLRALRDPLSLSPAERESIADRLGLTGAMRHITEISTNPAVLAGLAMVLIAPLPLPEAVAGFTGAFKALRPQFGPLRWVRAAHEIFRGTPIAQVIDKFEELFRGTEAKFERSLMKHFDAYKASTGAYPTAPEMFRVVVRLDGLDDPNSATMKALRQWAHVVGREDLAAVFRRAPTSTPLTEPLEKLAQGIQSTLDDMAAPLKDESLGTYARRILNMLQGFSERATRGPFRAIDTHYFPHVSVAGEKAASKYVAKHADDLTELTAEQVRNLIAETQVGPRMFKQVSPHVATRLYRMLPSPEHLERLGADPEWVQAIKRLETAMMEHRQLRTAAKRHVDPSNVYVKPIRHYSLDLIDVLSAYKNKAARMFAWVMPPEPGGKPVSLQLADAIAQTRAAAGTDPVARDAAEVMIRTLKQDYLPSMLGTLTPSELAWKQRWASMKSFAADQLTTGPLKKVMPGPLRQAALQWLQNDLVSGWGQTSGALARYFYGATLGFGLLPALVNLTQAPLTLMGVLGPADLAYGYTQLFKRLPKVLNALIRQTPLDEAVQAAFPEIAGEWLQADDVLWRSLEQGIRVSNLGTQMTAGKFRAAYDKLFRASLAMFQSSETVNRIAGFYGAYNRGLRTLAGKKLYHAGLGRAITVDPKTELGRSAVRSWAHEVVTRTQFSTDISGTPLGILHWNPLVKQFVRFPARMLEYVTGPAAPWRNPGATGGYLATSGLLYETFKRGFQSDVSRAVLFGPLPGPMHGAPFEPAPFLPPIFQLAGALLDPAEHGPKALSLLVPGGVAAARAIPVLAPTPIGSAVGRLLGRHYTDYSQPIVGEDGMERFPIYRPDGTLVQYQTRGALLRRALGLGTGSDAQERSTTAWVAAQRDRIRQYKRDYLMAQLSGDYEEAARIEDEYMRAYPGTNGFPLRTSDINALHAARNVSRLERVLQTVPPEVRPQLQATIAISMGAGFADLMGLQQAGLLDGATILQRDRYRYRPRAEVARVLSRGYHGVKLTDKAKEVGLSREVSRRDEFALDQWAEDLTAQALAGAR